MQTIVIIANLLFPSLPDAPVPSTTDDTWDCYEVEGVTECRRDIYPCHYASSPDECTVIVRVAE